MDSSIDYGQRRRTSEPGPRRGLLVALAAAGGLALFLLGLVLGLLIAPRPTLPAAAQPAAEKARTEPAWMEDAEETYDRIQRSAAGVPPKR